MAEAALFGIAKSVLQQLASPALDEFRLLWGHKEQFEKLEDTVATVRDVLEDADRKQATDATVRGWLARLRDVLYDADDLFDDISGKILLEKYKKDTKIGKKCKYWFGLVYFIQKEGRLWELPSKWHINGPFFGQVSTKGQHNKYFKIVIQEEDSEQEAKVSISKRIVPYLILCENIMQQQCPLLRLPFEELKDINQL